VDTDTKKAWEAFRPTDVGIFIVIGILSVFVFDHQKNIDNNKLEIKSNYAAIDNHMKKAKPRVIAEIKKVEKLTEQVTQIAESLHISIQENTRKIDDTAKDLVKNKISEMEARFRLEKKLKGGEPAQ
jgi:F0F1-type ATP synthase membrane subunit b/b'